MSTLEPFDLRYYSYDSRRVSSMREVRLGSYEMFQRSGPVQMAVWTRTASFPLVLSLSLGGSVPTVVTDLPVQTDPPRKRWTRAEYQRLSDAALNHERLELVYGELISKTGKKRPHVVALVPMQTWLTKVFGARFVNPEAPIDVAQEDNPASEPEPDIIVLKRDMSEFLRSNPSPHDVHLVVEIADRTLGFDLTAKAELYARAMIRDYWVVDIPGRRIVVHREPDGRRYGIIVAYGESERVAPLAAPDSELRVHDVIPG